MQKGMYNVLLMALLYFITTNGFYFGYIPLSITIETSPWHFVIFRSSSTSVPARGHVLFL